MYKNKADNLNKNEDSIKTNIFIPVNNDKEYYNKIYNYLVYKKLNINEEGKVNWKKVIYPKLFNDDAKKSTKDKKTKFSVN